MLEQIELVGFMATFLSSISVIPQAMKIYKTKDATSVSTLTFTTLALGNICWNIYSAHNEIMPMFISSTLLMIFTFTVLSLKFNLWLETRIPKTSLVTQDLSLVLQGLFNKYALAER